MAVGKMSGSVFNFKTFSNHNNTAVSEMISWYLLI